MRRKIRLIGGNAKCCHLKKLTCKETLRLVFICLRPDPDTPHLDAVVYRYTCIQYTYSHRKGGEGDLTQREGERVQSQTLVENSIAI